MQILSLHFGALSRMSKEDRGLGKYTIEIAPSGIAGMINT